jgi:hypothetical protein
MATSSATLEPSLDRLDQLLPLDAVHRLDQRTVVRFEQVRFVLDEESLERLRVILEISGEGFEAVESCVHTAFDRTIHGFWGR